MLLSRMQGLKKRAPSFGTPPTLGSAQPAGAPVAGAPQIPTGGQSAPQGLDGLLAKLKGAKKPMAPAPTAGAPEPETAMRGGKMLRKMANSFAPAAPELGRKKSLFARAKQMRGAL